jgi:hypothetical protein
MLSDTSIVAAPLLAAQKRLNAIAAETALSFKNEYRRVLKEHACLSWKSKWHKKVFSACFVLKTWVLIRFRIQQKAWIRTHAVFWFDNSSHLVSNGPASKGPGTKGPASKGPANERSGVQRSGLERSGKRKVRSTRSGLERSGKRKVRSTRSGVLKVRLQKVRKKSSGCTQLPVGCTNKKLFKTCPPN